MSNLKSKGIVLRSIDFGEYDRILTIYTYDFGKISGIAKGAKRSIKRFGNCLDIFSYIDIVLFKKGLKDLLRIESCDIINPFTNIRDDIITFAYASYMIELVDKIVYKEEKNVNLFDLLIYFLSLLNEGNKREELIRIFELRFISILGFRPNLNFCVVCKSRNNLRFFDIEKGGVVCNCSSENSKILIPISLSTIKTLALALRAELNKLNNIVFSKEAIIESKEILPQFIQYHCHKECNSLNFIEDLLFNNF
jgi:DNA repair protein RecO (recombination protein O)